MEGLALFVAAPAIAQSCFFSPDVPTDLSGTTYLPWNIVRNDSGVYSLVLGLPNGTPIDALHAMDAGDWLFSVEATTELPPGRWERPSVSRRRTCHPVLDRRRGRCRDCWRA